ncbi:MAG: hypothetical protein ACLTDX_16300 [[Clostridium] innocuum]
MEFADSNSQNLTAKPSDDVRSAGTLTFGLSWIKFSRGVFGWCIGQPIFTAADPFCVSSFCHFPGARRTHSAQISDLISSDETVHHYRDFTFGCIQVFKLYRAEDKAKVNLSLIATCFQFHLGFTDHAGLCFGIINTEATAKRPFDFHQHRFFISVAAAQRKFLHSRKSSKDIEQSAGSSNAGQLVLPEASPLGYIVSLLHDSRPLSGNQRW